MQVCVPEGLVVVAVVALALVVTLALTLGLAVVAVGPVRPPVRPIPSVLSSDCSCREIQL